MEDPCKKGDRILYHTTNEKHSHNKGKIKSQ